MTALIKRKKPKRVYRMEEVNKNDIDLLRQAASTPKGSIFCFGLSWYKLSSLNLIDEESNVTHDGLLAIRSLQ